MGLPYPDSQTPEGELVAAALEAAWPALHPGLGPLPPGTASFGPFGLGGLAAVAASSPVFVVVDFAKNQRKAYLPPPIEENLLPLLRYLPFRLLLALLTSYAPIRISWPWPGCWSYR